MNNFNDSRPAFPMDLSADLDSLEEENISPPPPSSPNFAFLAASVDLTRPLVTRPGTGKRLFCRTPSRNALQLDIADEILPQPPSHSVYHSTTTIHPSPSSKQSPLRKRRRVPQPQNAVTRTTTAADEEEFQQIAEKKADKHNSLSTLVNISPPLGFPTSTVSYNDDNLSLSPSVFAAQLPTSSAAMLENPSAQDCLEDYQPSDPIVERRLEHILERMENQLKIDGLVDVQKMTAVMWRRLSCGLREGLQAVGGEKFRSWAQFGWTVLDGLNNNNNDDDETSCRRSQLAQSMGILSAVFRACPESARWLLPHSNGTSCLVGFESSHPIEELMRRVFVNISDDDDMRSSPPYAQVRAIDEETAVGGWMESLKLYDQFGGGECFECRSERISPFKLNSTGCTLLSNLANLIAQQSTAIERWSQMNHFRTAVKRQLAGTADKINATTAATTALRGENNLNFLDNLILNEPLLAHLTLHIVPFICFPIVSRLLFFPFEPEMGDKTDTDEANVMLSLLKCGRQIFAMLEIAARDLKDNISRNRLRSSFISTFINLIQKPNAAAATAAPIGEEMSGLRVCIFFRVVLLSLWTQLTKGHSHQSESAILTAGLIPAALKTLCVLPSFLSWQHDHVCRFWWQFTSRINADILVTSWVAFHDENGAYIYCPKCQGIADKANRLNLRIPPVIALDFLLQKGGGILPPVDLLPPLSPPVESVTCSLSLLGLVLDYGIKVIEDHRWSESEAVGRLGLCLLFQTHFFLTRSLHGRLQQIVHDRGRGMSEPARMTPSHDHSSAVTPLRKVLYTTAKKCSVIEQEYAWQLFKVVGFAIRHSDIPKQPMKSPT